MQARLNTEHTNKNIHFKNKDMKTSQGFKYSIKNNILTLKIPKTMGEFNTKVQEARRELCLNHSIYFTEIKTIKI